MTSIFAWSAVRRCLAVAAVAAVLVALVAAKHVVSTRRQTADYIHYVNTYVGGWSSSAQPGRNRTDSNWAKAHPDAVLVEGRRACSWLADQPDAPAVDPTGGHAEETMTRRYTRTSPLPSGIPLAFPSEFALVAGAWTKLCPTTFRIKTAARSNNHD